MPTATPHLLLVLLLLYIHNNFFLFQVEALASNAKRKSPHTVARFELIHRHAPQLFPTSKSLGPPKTVQDRIKELVHIDNVRQKTISSRRDGRRRKAFEMGGSDNRGGVMIDIPMRSAADYGIGQYFVSFRVGSPHPQKFVLIADTGSDLTWMNCKYNNCESCPKAVIPHPGRTFHADSSPSFKTIPCSGDICKIDLAQSFSLAHCPSPETPCLFDYRYADGTRTLGVFANETVTVGLHNHRKMKLHDVLIGCSESYNGTFSDYDTDGIMGLGYNKHSFAVKAAEKFGNKFSYCLVDHLSPSNVANYLSFGDINTNSNMQYTELLLGYMNPYYVVNVSGISVGGNMLEISSQVWNISGDGGVILDSGTSLTFLAAPAYAAVMDAFKNSAMGILKKVNLRSGSLEYCFEDEGFRESLVPKLAIHFANGAILVPPVKSYVLDADERVKCLGFAPTNWPGTSVIGNIMQQNHFWEFDLGESKLGFAPSSCSLFE